MLDVRSDGPFRVASLLWQPRAGELALTIVCKATFLLVPGEARLAPEQEPPNEDDNYWDDDATRSLYAPGDLVPFKPRVDVLLAGNACAPGHGAVRSILARLQVGSIDKAIAVFGERTVGPDGLVREGAGFTRMPLRWERAAGGPGTANPVGMRWDGEGTFAPNLQPPSLLVARRSDPIPPVGFGPIAPWWPERQHKLGRQARALDRGLFAAPIPADLDPGFFNAAPADQQLDELRDDERIVLDHVHPEHARLVTALPGVRPRARARRGAATEEVPMRADTLWIDADRGICSVLWRGRIRLASHAEQGQVLVDTAPQEILDLTDVTESGVHDEGTQAVRFSPATPLPDGALPFRQMHAAQSAVVPAPESQVAPPPYRPPPAAPTFGARAMAAPPPQAAPIAPPPASTPVPPRSAWSPSPTHMQSAGHAGVLEASNAAAARHESPVAPAVAPAAPVVVPAPRPAAPARPREVIRLVWHDPAVAGKLLAARPLRKVLLESDLSPAEDVEQAMAGAPEAEADETRRRVSAALTRGEPLDEPAVRAARVEAAREDGLFEPPLALVAGELSFPFDELEALRATLTAVAPSTVADRKLKEAIGAVNEVLGATPLEGSGSLAGELTRQVTEAFAQAKRSMSPEQLGAQVERILLLRRGYQKRPVLGEERIRALLTTPGSRDPIPTYLAAALAKELPLVARFGARLLVEIDTRQDPEERHPAALRALALALVVEGG